MLQKGKVNFVMGISIGSEGKGNVAGYIGEKYANDIDLAITNNGTNSGHQFSPGPDGTGEKLTAKVMPVTGIVAKKSHVLIGPGATFSHEHISEEIKKFDVGRRLTISATAPVINEKCIAYEKEHLNYIASTFQGVGAALGLKAMRSKDIQLVKDYPDLNEKYGHFHLNEIIFNRCGTGKTAVCEIPQGYGLSIDSEMYPYVTSRNANIGQSMAYLDIPPSMVGNRIGITRSYMIRVGNVANGYSGDTFFDSKELSWEELSSKIGRDVKEMTTVTKRVRRVFTFSKFLFERAVKANDINILFMTFADYLDKKEEQDFVDYFTSKQFKFEQIYFVYGHGEYSKNIKRIK